jgi:hypothetical protein
MPIEVRSSDIDNITLNAIPTAELEVRFNLNGNIELAPPNLPNLLTLVPLDHTLPMQLRPRLPDAAVSALRGSATPEVSRKFSQVLEGEYELYPSRYGMSNPNGYIADMRQGGKSILENGIIAVGKGTPDPVEISFRRGGAAISGIVEDSGKPPASAFVILIPNGTRRQNPLLFRRYQADSDGKFNFQGVTPGAYTIFAWDSDPNGGELVPEFIQRHADSGRPIVVDIDSKSSGISVPVIHSTR